MPCMRTTSTSIAAEGQTNANHEQLLPVTKRGRGKKKTAGHTNETAAEEVHAQDLVVANTRTDADIEIAELKGNSHEHTSTGHLYDLLTFFAAQLVTAQCLQQEA